MGCTQSKSAAAAVTDKDETVDKSLTATAAVTNKDETDETAAVANKDETAYKKSLTATSAVTDKDETVHKSLTATAAVTNKDETDETATIKSKDETVDKSLTATAAVTNKDEIDETAAVKSKDETVNKSLLATAAVANKDENVDKKSPPVTAAVKNKDETDETAAVKSKDETVDKSLTATAAVANKDETDETAAVKSKDETDDKKSLTATSAVANKDETNDKKSPTATAAVTKKDVTDDKSLTVIVVHYNPFQYKRRAVLVNDCLSRLCDTQRELNNKNKNNKSRSKKKKKKKKKNSNKGGVAAKLHIVAVELTYDDRDPEIIHRDGIDVIHSRVSSRNIMWSKEQLINKAIRQLPETRQYIAWIDSDIGFKNVYNWVENTIQTLSRHPKSFAQLFATCDMLGPDGKVQVRVTSFAKQYTSGKEYQDVSNKHRDYWHPGFAWAATRQALKCTNGLIAKTLGSADRHMAMSFLGRAAETVPSGLHPSYLQQVIDWEQLVLTNCLELVVVPLKIVHFWHGSLKRRRYMERWNILKTTLFDWTVHLDYDEYQDLYIWSEECPKSMVSLVCDYFEQRLEDSNIVDDDEEDEDDAINNAVKPTETPQVPQPSGEDPQEAGTAPEGCSVDDAALSSARNYLAQFLPDASTGDTEDFPALSSGAASDNTGGAGSNQMNSSDGPGGGDSLWAHIAQVLPDTSTRDKEDPPALSSGTASNNTGGAGPNQVTSSNGPGPSDYNDPPTGYVSAFTGYA